MAGSRASPEAVILSQLAALQQGHLQRAAHFLMSPGSLSSLLPQLMASFKHPPHSRLVAHREVQAPVHFLMRKQFCILWAECIQSHISLHNSVGSGL
jgi:hypothetical protein